METLKLPTAKTKTLIGKLEKGKEHAARLKSLLHKPASSHHSNFPSSVAHELTLNILSSFESVLYELSDSGVGEVMSCSQIPAAAAGQVGSACSGDRRSESSIETFKRLPVVKDRRGCYKRRKSAESQVRYSPKIEDGHAWRKYGQKRIQNSQFPRCYFRCTHKYDQKCKAVKQVQMVIENPVSYQITYINHHTCKDTLRSTSNLFPDSDDTMEQPNLLNFETGYTTTRGGQTMSLEVKVENKSKDQETESEISEEHSSELIHDDNKDPFLWQDVMAAGPSTAAAAIFPPNMDASYHGEVSSGLHLDVEYSFDRLGDDQFDNFFKFDDACDHQFM